MKRKFIVQAIEQLEDGQQRRVELILTTRDLPDGSLELPVIEVVNEGVVQEPVA